MLKQKADFGFTIIELLVVTVVIGILAAITILAFTGISQKATAASLQTDLSGASRKLQLYQVEYGSYPTEMSDTNGTLCPTAPIDDPKYCIIPSPGNIFPLESYSGDATTFTLDAEHEASSVIYRITNDTGPTIVIPPPPLSAPTLINPTSTGITSTTASIGATISSDGGDAITETGTCWGTSPNPTTNCAAIVPRSLTAAGSRAAGSNPKGVVISADGASVYTTNYGSNTISIYSRNTSSGALTSGGTIATGTSPYGITISSNGASVYATNESSRTISIYNRNISTGALTSGGTIAITGYSPQGIAISASGSSVYVANSGSSFLSIYNRNISTGALTAAGTITGTSGPRSIAISADDSWVYAANSGNGTVSIYSRNTSTGALTSGGTIAAGSSPWGITISPNGASVYVTNNIGNTVSIYNRNTGTGALTAVGTAVASFSPQTITISTDGGSVYTTESANNRITIYDRDISTGALTAAGTTTVGTYPQGIVVSADSSWIYTTAGNYVYIHNRTKENAVVGTPFAQFRTAMPSNTLIYYRAYSINGVGTSYSSDGTFTTLP